MDLQEMIRRSTDAVNATIATYNEYTSTLNTLRAQEGFDTARETELMTKRAALEGELQARRAALARLEAERDHDQVVDALSHRVMPAGVPGSFQTNQKGAITHRATGKVIRTLDDLTEADTYEVRGGMGTQSQRTSASSVDRATFVRTNDLLPATVGRSQRTADHPVANAMLSRVAGRDQAIIGQHGNIGELVRAMSTTSGSAVVPSVWAADVIDRARNLSAVIQAGAQIVPMDAKTVQIGRLTGDPTATFRAENSAITASDLTLDNVTLTATTMSALVVGSIEWFQDAQNSEALVSEAIAQAVATQLDLVCLYGSITSGAGSINLPTPNNPRGILGALNANASSSVLGGATNGTTQTANSFWNEMLDLIWTPRDYNEAPNALIWNSKAARLYAKAYDTTGQPLQVPADITALQRFVSNQIPSYTQGTMTNTATDVFTGDFTQLLIGQRLDLHLQVLDQTFAENGQIGIMATWRGDVGLARPRAFAVYKAIKGA